MFSQAQIDALSAKLDKRHVATRTQQGKTLSYIEGWWAIAEANRIFGFDGWQRETVALQMTGEPYQTNGKWRVGYLSRVLVRVRSGDDWIVREGTGYGSGIGNDLNDAHESAAKEAETDAMKRALMTFGNPFGLALYDKQQANVEAAPAPQAVTTNPTDGEPGGKADVLALTQEWADKQAKAIDGFLKAGNFDALRTWRTKHNEALHRLGVNFPEIHERLIALFDDVYSELSANLRMAG